VFQAIGNYTRWLHTMWPAGAVEKLPDVGEDGSTGVAGLYIVGDLTGIPLLKFSAHTGAQAVRTILADPAFASRDRPSDALDLVIVGGGVSGMAAALEAKKAGLRFEIIEAAEPFSTVVNFPKAKPIYTYPTDMRPAGDLQFTADIRESLIEELHAQIRDIKPICAKVDRVTHLGGLLQVHFANENPQRNLNPEPRKGAETATARDPLNPLSAHRVIVAIGRSGNHRRLNVAGENLPKVSNRLHDPKDFADQSVLVVGGGDSALETAIAIAECGGRVALSYRKAEFSRPKPENIERLRKLARDPMADVQVERPSSERQTTAIGGFMDEFRKPGEIRLLLGTQVKEIREMEVVLTQADGKELTLPNDAVFSMIGREAPLDFLRRSGVRIRGEWTARSWLSLAAVLLICIFIYHWKKGVSYVPINKYFADNKLFPYNLPEALPSLSAAFSRPSHLLGTLKTSLGEPGFYYSVAYCLAVIFFGLARIRRRKTLYVRIQTYTLMAIQVIPLFLLPYVLLPWAGNNGWFDDGFCKTIADALFPIANYGHGREYWRSFGLILAWPLFFYNVFTNEPMWTWLAISFVQTFVLIPAIIYFWGKGAYCGWICSCGALAETLGDAHRHKMPHGPGWNRFNMLGQAFLALAALLLVLRVIGWIFPGSFIARAFYMIYEGIPFANYVWFVDLLWAGILGVGLYWHFSGRVWCRFACPLAALMHIYARFSRFRILADKKKCISCNVCTSVCHQGIDIMNFANKGLPMADPQCVRCSACVQMCPTGVLSFGQIDPKTNRIIKTDQTPASPVQMVELRLNGKTISRQKELVNA
jgi:thioredoxin reductase/polyferredoxin